MTTNHPDNLESHASLRREIGVSGAVMMGLGSIVGTGVFVSIGIAAGVAGPAVIVAIAVAACVATFNALNSAQLAASHPVSGGTYAYGYKYLSPSLGFTAGWMFLCAKSASAATAALGFAGYFANALGMEPGRWTHVGIGVTIVALLTLIVLCGIRQSNRVNIAIVSTTILSLAAFIATGASAAMSNASRNFGNFQWQGLPEASALMFVAFTGYGRIATLGEEVQHPRQTIPRAIVITLWFSALLYVAVALVAVGAVGATGLGNVAKQQAAPLEYAARMFSVRGIHYLVTIGAMAAMLGVLLNLILGLSRVLLAMGRRGDMPHTVAKLDRTSTTPWVAVIIIGSLIACLVLIGNIKTTWSFSAFTVLIYYAITNLAALFIPSKDRLYDRWIAWAGLIACLGLAFWVEWQAWLAGVAILLIGMLWHIIARRMNAHSNML